MEVQRKWDSPLHIGKEMVLLAGGDVGYFIPFYSMYSRGIFSFNLYPENSIHLLTMSLIWLIITLYLKYKHETVLW